ncbi:MAG: hypothetical protein K2W82_07920 [Candidatus Obscuribacterales bacterium]|nr:hypothetical protein [Candidatus Obscuribacterales bacterium]
MKSTKYIIFIAALVFSSRSAVATPLELEQEKLKLAGLPTHPLTAHESQLHITKTLSPDARTLASQMGILSSLEEYVRLRGENKNLAVQNQLNLLNLRQTLLEEILTISLTVRSTCNRIDRELADTNQVLAYQAERRDRAVRLNTYANFLSGGVSGIVRGSLKLGNIPDITPEIIETTEGTIQTSLATWALRQQQGDRNLERHLPNTLAKIIVAGGDHPPEIAESVWTYLNTVPAKGKITRRMSLLDRWSKLNMCLMHGGHRESPKVTAARIAGTYKVQEVNIAVLQDRVAMLTELRVLVLGMDDLLLELIEVLNGKRSLA